jgi:hypothetical protein
METESIMFQTIALFGVTIVLALAKLAFANWWVMRRKGAHVTGTRNELPGTPS